MTEDIQPVHGHMLSLLDPADASAVLDLGCGRGEHLRTLEELAARDQYFNAITMFSYMGTKADQRRL